jgi:hypothetical protein
MKLLNALYISALAFTSISSAHATKLDLYSNLEIKAANYSNLINNSIQQKQSYYSENAELGFVIKGITLEKTQKSSMDIGIVLQTVGTGASTNTVSGQHFQDALERYPENNGSPFLSRTYIKIYKFMDKDITATFGRQEFTLGQGITLSDDNLGFPGVRLEFNTLHNSLKGDFFIFRLWDETRFTKVFGASFYLPSDEGLWQFYYFKNTDGSPAQESGFNLNDRTKNYTGIRYFLSRGNLSFDGEFVKQTGKAVKTAGGNIDYNGHAFMMKGSWRQKMGFLGKVKARLAYGKSSGNSSAVTDTDKMFLPTFGHKYKGFERDGYGAIMGASLYDTIKTSNTVNGLPDGVSGLNIIGFGIDFPYKKLLLSIDFMKFRAAQNISGDSLQIGSELDLNIVYPMSESLSLKAVYATFTPQGVYAPLTEKTKLASFAIVGKF